MEKAGRPLSTERAKPRAEAFEKFFLVRWWHVTKETPQAGTHGTITSLASAAALLNYGFFSHLVIVPHANFPEVSSVQWFPIE